MGLKHRPDFEQFLKVLRREGRPDHLPLYEHIASPEFVDARTGRPFSTTTADDPEHWRIYIDFWVGLGFDCIPMEIPLKCPLAQAAHGAGRGFASEERAVIHSMEEFEKYPWPDESSPIRFDRFETVSRMLPEGAKIVGGVCKGPYEWV